MPMMTEREPAAERKTGPAGLLVGRRRWFLVAAMLASLLLGAGLMHTGYNASLSVLLPAEDPYLEQRDRLREQFPAPGEISFALVPDNGRVFSTPTLEALADLNRRFRQIPYTRRMDSILNYRSPFGEISPLPSPWNDMSRYSAEQLSEARRQTRDNPLVNGILLSPEADLALATITLSLENADPEQSREMAEATLELQRELRQDHPGVEIHVSSETLFEQSTREAMLRDLSYLLPIVMALCSLLICYCFRSWILGSTILVVSLLTVALTTGTLGWMGLSLNTVSVMAPLVVVIVAVADSVHILSVYRQKLKEHSPAQAMRASLAFNMRPVTLATLTTGIGFASLNLVSAPALSDFGSIVTLGVVYAWLVTMLVLPSLVIATAPFTPSADHEQASTRLTDRPLNACQRLVERRTGRILGGVALLTAVAVTLLPLNEIDFNRMDFISTGSPVHAYYDAVSQRVDRGPLLNYGIETEPGELASPGVLQGVDRFAARLRQHPDVVNVASLVEVVKTVHQTVYAPEAEEIGESSEYRIPDSAARVRDLLNDYRQVESEGYALERFVTPDLSTMRFFVDMRRLSNRDIVELDRFVADTFTDTMPQARLLHGSSTVLFARMDQSVTGELMLGYAMTLVVITLVLIAGLRSFFHGLLSLLPNALPAIIVFGFWGLFAGQLDPFVLMLFSISIGLVVDDTVHILSTWLRGRSRGLTGDEAMREALQRAGPALIITTAVLALGTLVLTAASTLYFQQAARLLVPIVVLALVLDLTFLPALLKRLHPAR